MKKALSIILCLAMLMSTVPMSVFAAPQAVTTGDSYIEFVPELPQEDDSVEADLAAAGTVAPVSVSPKNGETVDRRYPVAYYKFAKSVVIDPADVTLENIGNEAVGGVYFEEETNTILVFPAEPLSTVYKTGTVEYTDWTSGIAAADGSLLYFPGVNFNLEADHVATGENLVAFGDMEYGWTPFDFDSDEADGCFSVVEDPANPDNHVALRTWKPGTSKWPHAHVDVPWKPGSTYKVVAKVMVKDFVNDAGTAVATASSTITPNPVYTVPSFSCISKPPHPNQTGTVCTVCTKRVDREHETSFSDHPLQTEAADVSMSNGVSNGWQTIEVEFTVRDNAELDKPRRFSIYANPANSAYAAEFYIDDIEVYEQVAVSFAEGRNSANTGRAERDKLGYVGETVTLPATRNFSSTKEGYVIDGWTDGTNTYAASSSYTITGPVVLTPNVVPAGDGYKVTLSVPEEFADSYAGPGVLTVAVGEELDLSEDTFALSAPVGYSVLGWKNADTNEFVTSVSGESGEVINLVAEFELRTGIVVDTAEKASELDAGSSAAAFDEAVPGLKVTPANKDPYVIFDNLAIVADEYSFVDVTYAANDALASANGGEVYFFTNNTTVDAAHSAKATKLGEDAGLVTYRYDLAANANWVDVCSAIRIDPYNNNAEFTITEIQFVENEVVSEIAVTDLDVPAISEVPSADAVVADGAVYAIESITWDPADEYFMGSTEYTVTIDVAITESGYMFTDDTVALLNDENADVSVLAKSATITKTFAATEAPKAIEINLTSASSITKNDGTIELAAEIVPVNAGDVILPDTLTWEITGGDEGIATLDGNVLTAKWDGTVEVTAIPDYDAAQAKSFDIAISGQIGFNVYYDSNTGAEVENMPAQDRAKKDYKVSSAVPTRDGFAFAGWMLTPDGKDVVTELKVTKNTTLYAKWEKGSYVIDFDKAGDTADEDKLGFVLADGNKLSTSGVNSQGQVNVSSVDIDTEKGEAIIVLGGGNDFYMTVEGGTQNPINLDYVKGVEYGFRTDASGSFGYSFYFATKDEGGNWIAPDHATGGQTFIDNKITPVSTVVDGNASKLYVLNVDTTVRDVFRGNLAQARLDIENSQSFPGKTLYIDYIKFVGVESVENIELDVTAPKASDEVYGIDAVSTTSDKFVIKNVSWEGPELVDGKYYAGSAAYTAKVDIEAADGYALSDAPISTTVNGEDAQIVVNGDKATVTYTFPATEALETFTLLVQPADGAAAEITTSLGTLQLEKRFITTGGFVIPNNEVYWSIDPSQKKYGWVDANGLVTGNTDCEALVVTATSKYNPLIKTSVEIRVTGQIPEKNIYFAAGTGEEVKNLPEATTAKDEYELPFDVIPTRDGYIFKGWTKELGGEIVKVDDVKADTTYYAAWGNVKGEEFEGSSIFETSGATNKKFEDGVMVVTPTNANLTEGILLQKGSGIFGTGTGTRLTRVAVVDFEYIEIKTNIAPENLELCVYVMTNTAQRGTGTTTPWNETANTRFYSNKSAVSSNPGQNLFDYVEKQGDWYIYKLPTAVLKNWSNYLEQLRFNFIQRDMEEAKYVNLPYEDGYEAKFDHIRLVGRDIPAMDVVGIETPVVKGEAATTATAKQAEAFKVTNVEWSPELLGDAFFGSNTEYTVKLTVETLRGYKAFSNPPARVTVNGFDAEYTREGDAKATITYTFPATEDIGDLTLVNVSLHESTDDGYVTDVKQIFSGDDFDLTKFSATNNPTGKRWTGWSETEGGELISGTINITEDTDYYAYYEDITGYDFSNKYHKNIKNVKAANGSATFDDAWVVVTPEYGDSAATLTLDGMYISSADYDIVEIIYDGSLEDSENENKFNEEFAPKLTVNGTASLDIFEAALVNVEPVIASNRVSYKYTYDLTINGKPETITSFTLAPYTGKPAWAVTSVMLVPNADVTEAVAITGLDTPETWLMPDVSAEVNGNYEIVSVSWSADEGFNADGSFMSETAYTATIVVKATSGNKITLEEATVNGEAADSAVLGTDGKLTVKKTFAATEALVEFDFSVADAEITVADGTVKLVPVFAAAEGQTVPVQTVKWEILENGPENKSAAIDADGVVKAFYDGVVRVKVTSDYNPLKTAEATVTITNQIAHYAVTFDANTKSTVTNMPETAYVKLDYVLPKEKPVREGFSFAGWVKSPEDTVSVSKDYITKDTTYYALWVRGVHFEFNDVGETLDTHKAREFEVYDYDEGTYSFTLTGTDPQIYIRSSDAYVPGTPTTGYGLFDGNDVRFADIRIKTDIAANFYYGMYFESVDRNGKKLAPSYAENPSRYVANQVRPKVATPAGQFTNVILDMSSKSDWVDGYPTILRLDLPDDGTNASVGVTYTIDYIRFVTYETGVIDITGIEAPVVKATADTTAVSKDPSKYVVTNVAWEGGLIYDYYFGGETEYTVAVTVKGAPGYFVSDAPTKATINGKTTEDFEYNAATGELTVKYTFPATGVIDNDIAHELTLYGKDDNGQPVAETRTIFEGNSFELGTYAPANIPAGKRWIGWTETEGSTVNEVEGSIVVTEPKTYYAIFEDLVEFDYSNFYHQLGTSIKSGSKLTFEDGLAIVAPDSDSTDAALITPSMNIDGSDFGIVEVYYSAIYTSVHDGVKYDNRFSAQIAPALKFSTTAAPGDYSYTGKLVKTEKVIVGDKSFRKYTYDMTETPEWHGNVASLYLDPYNGFPNWGVGYIKLVENELIFDAAEIELASPEAWETPATVDSVSVNDVYEIKEVVWAPASEAFAANTSYTVKVTYRPVTGYGVSVPAATINGEPANVTDNGNGTYTASYTFEATGALKDVAVEISGASEIVSKGRYLELKGTTVAVDGSEIPVTDVTWSIKSEGTNVELATISENGRIYPISNGTVIVTATSVYNPKASATHEVVISNQADLVKVTFDKNTQAEVTGIPEAVYVYGNFVPEAYDISREGFFFIGWSVDEDSLVPDKSFNITEDTTLYAKWGAGYEFSFSDDSTALKANARTVTYSDGIATYSAASNGTNQVVADKSGLHTLLLPTASHQTFEVRLNPSVATMVKFYLQSSTADGATKSEWAESAAKGSTTGSTVSAGWQVISFNLGLHTNWNSQPYVEQIRLDLPQCAPSGSAQIDYIRLLSSERSVKFNGNGGLIPLFGGEVTSYKETYVTGEITLPEDPSREGYEFLGWAKKTEGYNKLYNGKFTVTDDVELFAIWTPAAVLNEDTVTAEGAEVTENEDGSVSVTSTEETTPVIKVADSMEVGENKIVVVELTADYASTSADDTVLSFMAGGQLKAVVLNSGELKGKKRFIVDLSEEGFEGTVTNVTLTLPTGVINNLTVDSVAFTTKELSTVFDETTGEKVTGSITVTATQGLTKPQHPGHISYPSAGGGAVTEHAGSTTVSPADKKPVVPARPKDDAPVTGDDKPGTTTPAASSKFALTKTYDGRFADVTSGNWFYADVEKSYRLGLMNGKSDTTFVPDGTVTLAEAITVAARMNAVYNGQTITQGTGNSWYQPYVDYAVKKAIVTNGQYSDYTAPATREQVALMFVRALPASWYAEKNLFINIPDVPTSHASYAAIQRLYNAGVITGVDDKYNFKPNDNIKRSELSAIINRVALPESRLRVITEDEKNNKDQKFGVSDIMSTLIPGNCLEKVWTEKDGAAYAQPAKPDPVVNGLQNLVGGSLDAGEYKTIKVVLTSSKASSMVGQQAQLFFSADGTLSEANSLRAKITSNGDGTLLAQFDGNSNAGWKGNLTTLRFDPWNNDADFSLISITFAP